MKATERTASDHLKTLHRRVFYLEERIDVLRAQHRPSEYEQAEAAALRWVLRSAGVAEPPELYRLGISR